MKTTTKKDLALDIDAFKKNGQLYWALNNKLRQKLIKFIHENESINVSSIYKKLRIEQSLASQQLGVLRRESLVNATRQGREVYYSLNYDWINEVNKVSALLAKKKPAKV